MGCYRRRRNRRRAAGSERIFRALGSLGSRLTKQLKQA
jgi:hypothetical protein